MEFSLSEEQKAFQDSVRAFARRELEADAVKRAHTDEFPREVGQRMTDAGLLGITISAAG